MTGNVKFFDARKRFGIITPVGVKPGDREREVFFYEDVLEGSVGVGDEVEYSLNPKCRDPRALRVKPLGNRSYVPINQPTRKVAAHGD
jgi:cold shock CspA family protein